MYRRVVSYKRMKTEHAGAKNGGGAWMTSLDNWGDLDQFSAHGSRGVLLHMTEDEESAGLSWEKFR